MSYLIRRGDEQFGPYTLSELQQYAQAGNVALDDLAQSEGSEQWIPVSRILGDIPIAAPIQVTTESLAPTVPLPLNVPWQVMLLSYGYIVARFPMPAALKALFGLVNFVVSILVMIWIFVLGNWARKLNGKNTALVLAALYVAGFFGGLIFVGIGVAAKLPVLAGLGGFIILGALGCMIAFNFAVRAAMEHYYNTVEDIALALSGGMTFFFNLVYFQFHINRIARWKQNGQLD